MNLSRGWIALLTLLVAPLASAQDKPDTKPVAASAASPALAFRVAKVVTMDERDSVINNAVVIVRDGKIAHVGRAADTPIPEDCTLYDYPALWISPGLVDCHNHTAGGLGDLNDMVYLSNPGLDSLPTIHPNNALVQRARRGGVTSMMLIPGSGTNVSGFGTIAKAGGDTPPDVVVRSPGSLKIAQAGNPEWYFGGVSRTFMNWNTRQTLLKAKAYHEEWEAFEQGKTERKPQFDPTFEGFRGLFRRDFPATVHTQQYQVLMTTVDMLVVQLGLWTVLDHCTFDAWKVAPLVRDKDVWTICGPRVFHFDQSAARMIGVAAGWWKNGMRRLGINTDAPVIPQEELSYQAAMACWYGWLHYPALAGVTRIPAQALGIYDRTGSIEPGKDADFSLWTGSPIDPRSACLITLVNGKIVYDGTSGIRRF